MAKKITAFIIGVISFFLLFAVGETFGVAIAFITTGIYFFLAQLSLSHKNQDATPQDWTLLLLLNTPLIATALLILLIEPHTKWHALACSGTVILAT